MGVGDPKAFEEEKGGGGMFLDLFFFFFVFYWYFSMFFVFHSIFPRFSNVSKLNLSVSRRRLRGFSFETEHSN